MFDRALELNKPVEAHLDQCNIPYEKETELCCDFVEKDNYEGKARAINGISLECHRLSYQKNIAQRLYNINKGVIV